MNIQPPMSHPRSLHEVAARTSLPWTFNPSLARLLRILLVCLVAAIANGCIYIPTKENGLLAGRGQITDEDVALLKEGTTTREDVLLRFGEPDLVLYNQRILVYRWGVSKGGIIVFLPVPYGGASGGGDVPKNYSLMLEFDDQGQLTRFERSGSVWSSDLGKLNEWTPKECEKLSSHNSWVIDSRPMPRIDEGTVGNSAKRVHIRIGEFSDRRSPPNKGIVLGESGGLSASTIA